MDDRIVSGYLGMLGILGSISTFLKLIAWYIIHRTSLETSVGQNEIENRLS